MVGQDKNLTNFGVKVTEEILPLVHRKAIVWSPTAKNKPAGFVGDDRRRDYMVYTSRRKPYHFYREGGGYAISNQILDRLDRVGVPRIIFHTADEEDVYEFATRKYIEEGELVPGEELLDKRDPQTYVPVGEALHVWDRENDPNDLFVQEFGDAMDRILGESR